MAHWGGGIYLQKYVFFMEMKKQNVGENVSLLQHHVAVYCIKKKKYLLVFHPHTHIHVQLHTSPTRTVENNNFS